MVTNTRPGSYVSKHSLKNKIARRVWALVYIFLFRPSPLIFQAWRKLLLTMFGANLGKVWIHPHVRIWAPWLLVAGDDVYFDRDVNIYNVYEVHIGSRVVISSAATLCTPSHDYEDPSYALCGSPIIIRDDCWICSEAFILPGVEIGAGSVVGARALVSRNVEPWVIVAGNPAKVIKKRIMKG